MSKRIPGQEVERLRAELEAERERTRDLRAKLVEAVLDKYRGTAFEVHETEQQDAWRREFAEDPDGLEALLEARPDLVRRTPRGGVGNGPLPPMPRLYDERVDSFGPGDPAAGPTAVPPEVLLLPLDRPLPKAALATLTLRNQRLVGDSKEAAQYLSAVWHLGAGTLRNNNPVGRRVLKQDQCNALLRRLDRLRWGLDLLEERLDGPDLSATTTEMRDVLRETQGIISAWTVSRKGRERAIEIAGMVEIVAFLFAPHRVGRLYGTRRRGVAPIELSKTEAQAFALACAGAANLGRRVNAETLKTATRPGSRVEVSRGRVIVFGDSQNSILEAIKRPDGLTYPTT